jgi:hypothetical protein
MKKFIVPVVLLAASAVLCFAADPSKIQTIQGYADSDICARLMLGPITPERIECSQSTHKEGAAPQIVRLTDNLIFEVNKMNVKDCVSKFVKPQENPKKGRTDRWSPSSHSMDHLPPPGLRDAVARARISGPLATGQDI